VATIFVNCLIVVVTAIVIVGLIIRSWQQKKPGMILTVNHLVVAASYGVFIGLVTIAVLLLLIMWFR
jgi:hypothetical protein